MDSTPLADFLEGRLKLDAPLPLSEIHCEFQRPALPGFSFNSQGL